MNWHASDCRRIVNGGYTWTVECDSHAKSSIITHEDHLQLLINIIILALLGPHLSDTYKLAQFHAHWGTHDCDGSEHTVDGREFAGEVMHYSVEHSYRLLGFRFILFTTKQVMAVFRLHCHMVMVWQLLLC
jgi:hypothetical protein